MTLLNPQPPQKPLTVACPHCKTPVLWCMENRNRPFCSERCRLIDLRQWANEAYVVTATNDETAPPYE